MPLFGQLISQLRRSNGNVQRLRTALFWNITQRIVVIPDRRFGTTFRSHFQGASLENGTDKLSENVGKELPLLAA